MRRARAASTAVLALALVLATPLSARANVGTNPTGGGGPQPAPSSSSGSSGGSVHGHVSDCSVYATSSSFGLSCVHGGGDGGKTVKQILAEGSGKPDPLPTCWDDVITAADAAQKYPDFTPVPGQPFYLESCVTGLDPDSTPADQPNLQLDQSIVEKPINAQPCPHPFPNDVSRCLLTLTDNQKKIVGAFDDGSQQIPDVVVQAHPSTRVRTGVATAYVDVTGSPEPKASFGAVTMYATMDSFHIYPYGPDGGVSRACDGTQQVSDTDTPATKPTACWWTYPKSSADEAGEVYPFRAEATWTVYLNGHAFDTFQKFSDLRLPVFDVQTLVVPGG